MFLLTDLATTTSENTGISLTITPDAALDKDYVIRYFITGAGLHPASTGSLLLSSGSVDFVSGSTAPITTTIGRTLNNLVKDYSKDVFTDFEQGEKLKLDLANKVTSTDISDVLAAFASGDQTNKWKVSKGNIITNNATNDRSKQYTYIHYGTYGQSDFYIRFIFEDLDFDLTGSNFEIV